ncbi:hypothetical protein LSH36_1262g00001 [Paralvinella palmiformis]|uniref:C-type lectin domain-containing protein n=1 Tax=Paralvinella palmiformis TaxID=53620 RepID=A0AAD9IUU6_9ANNE|nr:hypothetical protein LSH36_1262g00001 [Paralvinella palmiformis]
MKSNLYVISLLSLLLYFTHVNAKRGNNLCKRKQFTSINGYYHYGKVITVYDEVPLKMCITRCRIYSECRSFNMKWISPSRTFGICSLLQEVIVTATTAGAIYDENYTHLYWCPENMTYYLGTGVCVGNKTGATWHQGDLFCKSLYPGAHLIDIKSEEDQLAYLPLFGNILDRVISEHKMKFSNYLHIYAESFTSFWTSAKRPNGGERNEFYWTNSGERVTYTNWKPTEPYPGSITSNCVWLLKCNSYMWSDHNCLDNTVVALCEW